MQNIQHNIEQRLADYKEVMNRDDDIDWRASPRHFHRFLGPSEAKQHFRLSSAWK